MLSVYDTVRAVIDGVVGAPRHIVQRDLLINEGDTQLWYVATYQPHCHEHNLASVEAYVVTKTGELEVSFFDFESYGVYIEGNFIGLRNSRVDVIDPIVQAYDMEVGPGKALPGAYYNALKAL